MDTPFVMEQLYDSPVDTVWDALTDPDKMRVWYFPQLKNFEPVVGFNFEFVDDGSPYQKEWQVTQLVEGRRLAHSWVYKGYAGRSEVIFDLSAEDGKTRLRLTHTGLASFPDDPHFARERFEGGWQRILGVNLKQQLEGHG
jgi:uncharacterized protein YndB with AHSA1/START domain